MAHLIALALDPSLDGPFDSSGLGSFFDFFSREYGAGRVLACVPLVCVSCNRTHTTKAGL